MRGYNLHLDTGRREAKRTRLMSIAEEIKPGVYGLVSLLSFLVFAAAYTRDNYAIAAPVAVITIGFALVAMAMLYVRWRVEIADLRAERDHWKDVAGHAGERCVNLERVLADAQTRIAELEAEVEDWRGRVATQCGLTLAMRERCAALIDDPHWSRPDEGEQWWASDYASAAKRRAAEKIRALDAASLVLGSDPLAPQVGVEREEVEGG